MKKWLIFLLAFNTALLTVAQSKKAAIFVARQNILYLGVDNPIVVALENTRTKKVQLTIDNGTIVKQETGKYSVIPFSVGPTIIRIFEIKRGKTILRDSIEFRAKPLPAPTPFIGLYRGDSIQKKQLLTMGGTIAKLLNSDFDVSFQVVHYQFIVIRDAVFQKLIPNDGPRYNDAVKQAIEELKKGDHVLFTSILCKWPDGGVRLVQPMEFIITD